jgi:putative exosortase-associated protein (TIGR04073 family)
MKKLIAISLLALMILTSAVPAFADPVTRKLGRGICNMITFPWEMVEQIQRANNTDGPFAAFTYGIVKGLVMSCTRALVGVYETATFIIPIPKDYKPILKDPEFFFENVDW